MKFTTNQIFSGKCEFVGAAANIKDFSHLPISTAAEFAFIGRSNVGKSSLVNTLLRRSIARTSQTPGRTKQINFFLLINLIMIVDMPGYGYAAASKAEINRWHNTVAYYLTTRQNLDRLFVLIDSRHGIKIADRQFLDFISQYAIPVQFILTKADKATKSELDHAISSINTVIASMPMCLEQYIVTSSNNKAGIETIEIIIANEIRK